MYWRSASKPLSGDAAGRAGGGGVVLLFGALVEIPFLQPASNTARVKSNTRGRFISRRSQFFLKLLVPNVHDRAISVLVNDIKPAAISRVLEEVVMRVV